MLLDSPGLQRWTGIVLVAALMALTLRLPVPQAVDKPSDEDFPCKHHACGCVDAVMCRTACCCFKTTKDVVEPRSSCCSKRDAAGPCEESKRPLRLQSPSCAGIAYVLLIYGVMLSPNTAPAVNFTPVSGARIALEHQKLASSISLIPSTPPPRA